MADRTSDGPVAEPYPDSHPGAPQDSGIGHPPGWRLFVAVGHLAGAALLVMVAMQGAVVLLRAVFGLSLPALQDLVVYLHATAILLGLSVALMRDAHVRIAIRTHPSPMVDLLGSLVLTMPFAVLLTVLAWPYALRSWLVGEGSADAHGLGGVYVIKALIVVAAALLVAAGLARAVACGRRLALRR